MIDEAALRVAVEKLRIDVEKLVADYKEQTAENTQLRAALANSDQPCVYCSLPAADWTKCASGFPGCERGEDGLGCPHLGSGMELELLTTPLPMAAYHEDMGPVLWWRVPIEEPPYAGTPHDSDWTEDYYTHFTPLPQVTKPEGDLLP